MLKDFLEAQGYKLTAMERMNWRIKHVIEPLADLVRGGTVLDLGAHDGRWPIAYRDAGAAHVLGIEGRGDLVDIYKQSEEGKNLELISSWATSSPSWMI